MNEARYNGPYDCIYIVFMYDCIYNDISRKGKFIKTLSRLVVTSGWGKRRRETDY